MVVCNTTRYRVCIGRFRNNNFP